MTNEDKQDCLTLLKEIKDACKVLIKNKDKANDTDIQSFAYAIDQSVDVLVEIIENKPLHIEKMV
jgi:hypothetical protein